MPALRNPAPHGALIFCRVIDNFGDAGVTWRLAKRLHALGFPVTLVIDAVGILAKLVHELDGAAKDATVRGIRITDWDTYETRALTGDFGSSGAMLPDLLLETFGCRLPDCVEEAAADDRDRLWMNLDYLSAESWVEGSHNIWGLHPRLPVKKLWFFPGFTDKTGGVLIEDDLDERRRTFDRAAFLSAHGLNPALRTLYFFAYPTNAIETLAAGLRAAGELNLMLAPGAASDLLARALSGAPGVHLLQTPFVPQEAFDDWLMAADGVIIRGEDSFVRAQLSGTPLLWAIYPTEDMAHEIKLDAWLERFAAVFTEDETAARDAYVTAASAWVRGTLTPEAFTAWLEALPTIRTAALRWRSQLFARGDLGAHIAALVPHDA